ncbi:unnamed protein product [Brassica rapa]|uniref:Uncharacterized protein n=1 Tax=Brassica campestris TaxID=3711 RepID=A0A3P5YI01_BRACM|nr:unnamed protein product [Brassica rapa]VDC67317.1 unnamed protein product [Brassica rapa]
MSWIRRLDLIDPYYTRSPLIVRETSILDPSSFFPSFFHDDEDVEDLAFPFGFPSPSPLDLFETVTDLVKSRYIPVLQVSSGSPDGGAGVSSPVSLRPSFRAQN